MNLLAAWLTCVLAGCFPSFDGLSGALATQDSGSTVASMAGLDAAGHVDESSCQVSDGATHDVTGAAELLHLTFDEGTGFVANDSSGHCQTAVLQGGASWAAGRIGPHSLALDLSLSSYAQLPSATIDTSAPFSVALWVRLSSLESNQTMLGIDGQHVSVFYLKASKEKFFFEANESDDATSANAFAAANGPYAIDTWYHLAGVFDGASLSLYVYGMLQDSRAHSMSFAAQGPTSIGRAKFADALIDYTAGDIDDVRMYQGALTAEQVSALAAR